MGITFSHESDRRSVTEIFMLFVSSQFSSEYMYDCQLLAAVSYLWWGEMTVTSSAYVNVSRKKFWCRAVVKVWNENNK